MPKPRTPAPDPEHSRSDGLREAVHEIRGQHAPGQGEPDDRDWLRVGAQQPGRAHPLLGRLEPGAPGGTPATGPTEGPADEPAAEAEAAEPAGDHDVPLRSMLLARSATLPAGKDDRIDPDALFGWAARLSRDEVALMGDMVTEMLDDGASPDLARAFAITWRGTANPPERDFATLFRAFTELEFTVAGVLAGYDLRTAPRTRPQGRFSDALGELLSRRNPMAAEAAAIIDRAGKPAERGLVAMWNAWAAVRFRAEVPLALFDELVQPWVAVIGRLPEA
jgi:hypothetical protein